MPGVRDAAAALIGMAPESTVLTVLRMLVDSLAPASARAPEVPPPLAPRPVPPAAKPAASARPTADPAWETLRGEVKAAMIERGASFEDVAAAITRSAIGVRIMLGSRKPPKPIVRTRLQAWLEQAAPAVAAVPAPFPGSGTGPRGNGHADGLYGYTTAA
jgi:hypothetical protein